MDTPSQRPRATVARQLKALAVLAIVVIVFVGGGWGLFKLTVGRQLLDGDHDHDFGTVELAGEPVLLDHTFVLANDSSRPIEILEVKTSCSCTVAEIDTPYTLPAGATLELEATLSVSSDGRKAQRINLVCKPDHVETLHLYAAGRNTQRLVLPSGSFALAQGEPVDRTIIFYDYDSNDPPPPPRIVAPAGVRAEFDAWTIQRRRSSAQALPARWSGRLTVEQLGEALAGDAEVVITVGPDQTLRVPLVAAPPSAPGTQDRRAPAGR